MPRRFSLLYPAWILVCAILFFALRNSEDPSRRHDRILSNDAADRAVAFVNRVPQFKGYEAVHVAYESGRWIVLCDRVPHSALRAAVVVELDAKDGHLVRLRRPVN